MTDERRKAQRVQVTFSVRWKGVVTEREGIITDISTGGCFILTSSEVNDHERVRIDIQLPKEGSIGVWGEVVYQIPEMGFALRFTDAGEMDQKMLKWLVSAEARRAKD